MPLAVGFTAAPPPTVPGTVPDPTTAATWYAPDGTEWPLTTPALGWRTLAGVRGLGAPAVEITADALAHGGTLPRDQYTPARLITWPLRIGGATHQQFLTRWDALVEAFTQTDWRGPGRLVIARPDGRRREILALYQSGFEGEVHGTGFVAETAVLTLYCADPWWRDVDPVRIEREHQAAATPFLNPYPSVSSSRTLGATTVRNPGGVLAYPDWTIDGPATLITATHDDTGEQFVLDPNAAGLPGGGALVAGETITVTTDPLNAGVRGPAGENWSGALNWPGASLWALRPGDNRVTFSVTGSAAGTRIELAFKPRHRAA